MPPDLQADSQAVSARFSPSSKKSNRRGKAKIGKKAVTVLKNWLAENFQDPYPSFQEKIRLSKEAGITVKQVV